uniref:Uncharacterized protein n=1 Tax=Populus alba TaxID=43335 RepID=A0A4U5PZP9_POPAL|nr:hypothetical protein D5086_0000160820 [Populus alba]
MDIGMNQDGELSLKHSGYCTTRPSIEHFVGSCNGLSVLLLFPRPAPLRIHHRWKSSLYRKECHPSPAIPEPQAGDNLPPSTLSLGIESQALEPCPRPKSYPFSYGPNGKSRLPDARLEGELDGHTPSAICGWNSVGSGGPFLRQALAPSYQQNGCKSIDLDVDRPGKRPFP